MKWVLFFAFILLGTSSLFSQAYLKTRATGYATFSTIDDVEWENVKGYVSLYKEKVTYCNKENTCMEFQLLGKAKSEETKFKGKKYMMYSQSATTERGKAVEIRKLVAKNHDKYYDILWIYSEQNNDILIECSTLMKARK